MSETIIEEGGSGAVSTDDLQRMLDESRNRAASLERERDEALGRVRHVERERDTAAETVLGETERRYKAEVDSVDSALRAAKSDADRAEEAYVRAMDSNNWAEAGKAQRAIAEAAARYSNIENKKSWLEANKEQLVRAAEPRRRESSGDKYEGIVQDLLPAERDWLDSRPKFLSDTKFRAKVIGASQYAAADYTRGTPEYFREIERIIGEATQEAEDRVEAPPARRERGERSASADVAPQRHRPGAAPQGSREVRLTADQAEVADSLYGNPSSSDYIADPGERYKKYSANLERMRASGRM